jgi:endonuclease YncB( thermonuclease family)
MKHLLCIFFISITLITGFATTAAAESTLTGLVTHVRDGDTIELGELPIRLNGVSAPELNEPFGPQSKQFMRDLVLGKIVRCELSGEKTYDRCVGTCYLEGEDIGATVIKEGLALDCPRYSGGLYAVVESAEARQVIKLPEYCR